MPKRPAMFSLYPKPKRSEHDARRSSAHSRGYSFRWTKARILFLQHNPLCRFCQWQGRIEAATHVDHIRPHGGDMTLFWESDNWQGLCETCHNSIKRRVEMRNAGKDWTIAQWAEACEREVKRG